MWGDLGDGTMAGEAGRRGEASCLCHGPDQEPRGSVGPASWHPSDTQCTCSSPLTQRPGEGQEPRFGSLGYECQALRWGPPEEIWGHRPGIPGNVFSSKSFDNSSDEKSCVRGGDSSGCFHSAFPGLLCSDPGQHYLDPYRAVSGVGRPA